MTTMYKRAALAVAAVAVFTGSAGAQSLAGRWDATLTSNGALVPFRLDISGSGPTLKATLYNGEVPATTTAASLENGVLRLELAHKLTTIVATVREGQLVGAVHARGDRDSNGSPFQAVRHAPKAYSSAGVPAIGGLWEIPNETPKGEKAWRFVVRQDGAFVSAAILRVDGDTGSLTGYYENGKWVLSHFDGTRPFRLEVTPATNGTLQLVQAGNRTNEFTAYRPDVARAKGLPEPANFTTHTTMRDPNEVFTFKFPDINGHVLSNEDPKFKGKVVLAIVTGTWCPNCHDEAQYLVPLYKKYRDRGLEIVALDFEEPEQQDELARVKAFVTQYGVEYTYLIAGAPVEMWEKIPQVVNLNTWPATLFIGRDGRVERIHAGFAAPASGEFNTQLKQEFEATIERLLAERAPDAPLSRAAR